MSRKPKFIRWAAVAAFSFVLGSMLVLHVHAQQSAPAEAPSPATQAIKARKAVFTLIGNSFRPVADVLQGRATYDSSVASKSASRVAFLSAFLNDAFPDSSATGDTKARQEIWSNRADFDKRLKDFQDHSAVLVQVAAKETSNSDAFKAASSAVGQDCKGCHENYKAK